MSIAPSSEENSSLRLLQFIAFCFAFKSPFLLYVRIIMLIMHIIMRFYVTALVHCSLCV